MTTFTDTHILDDFTNRDFEQIVLCRDPEAGLESVIAVHDTTLGPRSAGCACGRTPPGRTQSRTR